ncbi:MAG TPA: M67 family metallopeptidase [Saprospiraceae bacterium]|nr:M67 family metallopeptidase [Saprospiraceae bacterium]MCC6687667.1 M67 family metallopeptidase [Saprospiraceae bacterium]HMV22944.1 M67 family metallopeptidase [Saprospiraceae bacterium]HMX84123.1 M67 family metallopeptidase [Saprospiraceae bacterium]HMX84550.1 M67 family metallopeptidase [Saprospiraceae bacterium]
MLHISRKTEIEILADALRSFPDECCGFMFGTENGEERTISEIQIVNNAKVGDKRRRFEITPFDYMKAEQYAEANNLLLLGVYHSHPNHPSVPSEHDRVVAQPYFSYLIIAVRENEFVSLQSWRLNDDFQFDEEQIAREAEISIK